MVYIYFLSLIGKKKKCVKSQIEYAKNTVSKHFLCQKYFHIKKIHIKIVEKEGGMTPRPPINAIYCSLNLSICRKEEFFYRFLKNYVFQTKFSIFGLTSYARNWSKKKYLIFGEMRNIFQFCLFIHSDLPPFPLGIVMSFI